MTFVLTVLAIILTVMAIIGRGFDQLANDLGDLALQPVKPKNNYEEGMAELCRRVRRQREVDRGKSSIFMFLGTVAAMMWVMVLLSVLT